MRPENSIAGLHFEARGDVWTARREFSYFAGHGSDERGASGLNVLIPPGARQPTLEQTAAVEFFLANEQGVCANVLDAIFRYYRLAQPGEAKRGEELPRVESPNDLFRLIDFEGMSIGLPLAPDGAVVTGFCFGCDWDVEHGLGVGTVDGTVISIGHQEAAQGVLYGHAAWATPEEQKQIGRFSARVDSLQRNAIECHQDPFFAAILAEDAARLRALANAGRAVNELLPNQMPPLVHAIQHAKPESVRTLLELGADVNAAPRHGGNATPLSVAQAMVQRTREAENLMNRAWLSRLLYWWQGGRRIRERTEQILRLLRDAGAE